MNFIMLTYIGNRHWNGYISYRQSFLNNDFMRRSMYLNEQKGKGLWEYQSQNEPCRIQEFPRRIQVWITKYTKGTYCIFRQKHSLVNCVPTACLDRNHYSSYISYSILIFAGLISILGKDAQICLGCTFLRIKVKRIRQLYYQQINICMPGLPYLASYSIENGNDAR